MFIVFQLFEYSFHNSYKISPLLSIQSDKYRTRKKTAPKEAKKNGKKTKLPVKIKKEPKSFVFTLETEDNIYYFTSQDALKEELKSFFIGHPNVPHRTGRYKDNAEANRGYRIFKSCLKKMSEEDKMRLYGSVIYIDDSEEDDHEDSNGEEDIDDQSVHSNEEEDGLDLNEIQADQLDNHLGFFYAVFSKDGAKYYHSTMPAQAEYQKMLKEDRNSKAMLRMFNSKVAAQNEFEQYVNSNQNKITIEHAEKEPTVVTPTKNSPVYEINMDQDLTNGNTTNSIINNPNILSSNGEIFDVKPLSVRLCQNKVQMEVSVFYPGELNGWDENDDHENMLLCFDLMNKKQGLQTKSDNPFWLFKPSLFGAVPIAEENESPKFFESYAQALQFAKREKPFGDNKPLIHMNKNQPWRHNMLAFKIKKHSTESKEVQVQEFINDFKKVLMTSSCQHRMHEVAEMEYSKQITALMNTLDKQDTKNINKCLWTNFYAALEDPKINYSNKLKEKFLDEDIENIVSIFFKNGNSPSKNLWPQKIKNMTT